MQRRVSSTEREQLTGELAHLEVLGLNELRARWRQLYETVPPPLFSHDLLLRAVAYRMQEQVLGGLKPAIRKLLQRVADEARARKPLKLRADAQTRTRGNPGPRVEPDQTPGGHS